MATTPNNSSATSASRKITITLDADLISQVDFLRSDNGNSFEAEVVKSVSFGITNRAYRKGYMVRRNQAIKQLPQQLAKASATIANLERQLLQLKQQREQQ